MTKCKCKWAVPWLGWVWGGQPPYLSWCLWLPVDGAAWRCTQRCSACSTLEEREGGVSTHTPVFWLQVQYMRYGTHHLSLSFLYLINLSSTLGGTWCSRLQWNCLQPSLFCPLVEAPHITTTYWSLLNLISTLLTFPQKSTQQENGLTLHTPLPTMITRPYTLHYLSNNQTLHTALPN